MVVINLLVSTMRSEVISRLSAIIFDWFNLPDSNPSFADGFPYQGYLGDISAYGQCKFASVGIFWSWFGSQVARTAGYMLCLLTGYIHSAVDICNWVDIAHKYLALRQWELLFGVISSRQLCARDWIGSWMVSVRMMFQSLLVGLASALILDGFIN